MNLEIEILADYLKEINYKGNGLTLIQQKEVRLRIAKAKNQLLWEEVFSNPKEAVDEAFNGIFYDMQTGLLIK